MSRGWSGPDLIVLVADFHRAGGEDEILISHGGRNVGSGKPLRRELVRIEVDHHLAELAAIRQRHRGALNDRQLSADEILPHIEQLLLAHGLALQAELEDGHAGGIILNDAGRQGPGRHGSEQCLRKGGDLGECQFDFGVRLEVYAGDGDAGIGLRLDVLDVVHRGGHGSLKGCDHALFHLFRGEAVVVPDDADYGDVDIRKDIDRHRNDGGNAKNGDEQGHHDEGIGAS